MIEKGGFCSYDFGDEYVHASGQLFCFELSKIATPVSIYYGSYDSLVDERDIKTLESQLLNSNVTLHKMNIEHNDFLFGKSAPETIFKPIIQELPIFPTVESGEHYFVPALNHQKNFLFSTKQDQINFDL